MEPVALYEDNHLLAVNKPAMLPTMGVGPDRASLLDWARNYIKVRYQKPGNVYLGIVSRLDAPVTGVVLIARTSKAAARLSKMFRERDVEKVYWALVEGLPSVSQGTLHDWIRKDERHRRVTVCSESEIGGQEAILAYRLLSSLNRRHLLEIRLETGRKHQIRVQLANQGWPVLGDRKYGSQVSFPKGIALHSRRLQFMHPVRDELIEIEADLPPSWGSLRGNE